MAHSRKDGRRRGGHRDKQCREVWSRRCKLVNMWRVSSNGHAPRGGHGFKAITHRYERRMALREIATELLGMDPGGAPPQEPGNG